LLKEPSISCLSAVVENANSGVKAQGLLTLITLPTPLRQQLLFILGSLPCANRGINNKYLPLRSCE
jgi:hypothetical protein